MKRSKNGEREHSNTGKREGGEQMWDGVVVER